VWTEEEVREELHKARSPTAAGRRRSEQSLHARSCEQVRSADEEEEVRSAAKTSAAEQLSLQPLYARPPPVWLHPAFGAEFCDPFIAQSPLEESSLHVSLEVLFTPPAHTPPLHTPPLHTPPLHTPPLHTAPLHTAPLHTSCSRGCT